MIVYPLSCEHGHSFEGWFASADAYGRQSESGQLSCPTCGSSKVTKLPSAPYVKSAGQPASRVRKAGDAGLKAEALELMRAFIIANTDDVGRKFAEVARRIHYQEEESRSIRGEVTPDEAAELEEEGVEAFVIPTDMLPSGEVH
ncbi:MAG: DUF1178 family protein [Usitatibacter sp.]